MFYFEFFLIIIIKLYKNKRNEKRKEKKRKKSCYIYNKRGVLFEKERRNAGQASLSITCSTLSFFPFPYFHYKTTHKNS